MPKGKKRNGWVNFAHQRRKSRSKPLPTASVEPADFCVGLSGTARLDLSSSVPVEPRPVALDVTTEDLPGILSARSIGQLADTSGEAATDNGLIGGDGYVTWRRHPNHFKWSKARQVFQDAVACANAHFDRKYSPK